MSQESQILDRVIAAEAVDQLKEKIFRDWQSRFQNPPALIDQLPTLIDQLILNLRHPELENKLGAIEKCADFRQHTLEQVTHEYQLLRVILLEALGPIGSLDSDVRETIYNFIDLQTGRTARQFSETNFTLKHKSVSASDVLWGGEMGAIVQDKDWSKTPLGPMETWPPSLRTTVSLCLASNFPIDIIWGPEHTQIYNDGYRVICGEAHPRALGENFTETWKAAWPVIGEPFAQANKGKTSYLENQRIFIERNGFMEETFFTFSFSPIRDETGEILGLFHPVTEVTATMLTERRTRLLREVASHTVKSSLAEAAGDIAKTLSDDDLDLPFALLYLSDDEGKAVHLAAATGLKTDSQLNLKSVDLSIDPKSMGPIAEAMHSETIVWLYDIEETFEKINCGPYPEAVKKAVVLPIKSPGLDRPLGFIVAGVSARLPLDQAYRGFYELLATAIGSIINSARNFQEERKRAEALAEIDRLKTAFFANVSHEFRTPLTLMLGPLEDNLADSALPPQIREREELAYRNALRLLKLVNSLLDFSRLEAGRVKAVYRPSDLSKLTANFASVFRSAIEKGGLKLIVDTPDLNEKVYVDEEMWEKIVLNLLSNAFKFTLHGEIEVKLVKLIDRVRLTVRDSGIGVSESEIPRLFERFHRVEGAQGRTNEGTGIGLAHIHELVKLHGGSISATSQLGKGTEFAVEIPLGKKHLQFSVREHDGDMSLANFGSIGEAIVGEAMRWLPGADVKRSPELISEPRVRILVADDNADMRSYLKDILQPTWNVETVADGEAALATASLNPPDLILSDVMMPKMDGFELVERLKENPKTKGVPIVLLSARAGEESRIEGLKFGADDYLVKPFSAKELVARVKTHLQIGKLRAEMERQNESLLSLFMRAPVAICVLEGPKHVYTLSNPLYDQLVQREVLGKEVRTAFTEREVAPFFKILDQVYESGEPYVELEKSVPFVETNGQTRERFINFAYQPLRDSQDKITGILAFHIDVTEQVESRKLIQLEQLKSLQSERRLQNALANGKMGSWEIRFPEGALYADANFRRFHNASEGENIQAAIKRIAHPEDQEVVRQALEKATKNNEPYFCEYRIMNADGSYKWVAARGVPSYNDKGEAVSVLGVAFEIGDQKDAEFELKKAKEDAEAANRFKSAFLANMSHEIRTPLGAMIGFADLIRDQGLTHGERSNYANIMLRNGEQLLTLINDILDLSKIESGHLTLEYTDTDHQIIGAEVVSLMQIKAQEKDLALDYQADPSTPPLITSDPTRVRQILLNLVSNAIKFTQFGSVKIRSYGCVTKTGNQALCFEVTDTGIGITAAQQEKLFQTFTQADVTTTRQFGGTGLGLVLSRRLARALGGEVDILKSEQGVGSVFVVTFADEKEKRSVVEEAFKIEVHNDLEIPENALKGKRILVVDDAPDNQQLIWRYLTKQGAIVESAENGLLGFRSAIAGNFDLVLMDIQMPVMDGYTATLKLREAGYTKPIIALTAHAMNEIRKKALNVGYTDHLTKPIDPKALIRSIMQHTN